MASSIRCVGLNVHMKALRGYKLHYAPCGMDEMRAALDKRGTEIVAITKGKAVTGLTLRPLWHRLP